MMAQADARAALRAKAEELAGAHYVCEDCWYSCPLSSEGCCDESQQGCNCGRDKRVERILAALADAPVPPATQEAERVAMFAHLFQAAARDESLSDLEARNVARFLSLRPITEADIARTKELAEKYGWEIEAPPFTSGTNGVAGEWAPPAHADPVAVPTATEVEIAMTVIDSTTAKVLARGIRMLGFLPREHPHAAIFNEALALAANYVVNMSSVSATQETGAVGEGWQG